MRKKVKIAYNGSKFLQFPFWNLILYFNIFFRPYTCKCLPGANAKEFTEKVNDLKKELSKLCDYEQELDLHRLWIEQSIRNTTEDLQTKKYLYITGEDFLNCFDESDTVLIINAPLNKSHVKFQVSHKKIIVHSTLLKLLYL